MADVIKVEGLKKYFKDIKAVDDISFKVKEGELFGFLGENGAGKSTTINILCTLLKETQGRVSICGHDLDEAPNEIRKKIGVVFQENTLDYFLTVRENLIIRGSLYEKDKKKVKENIVRVSNILSIEDILDRQFRKLSGGQRRRCEIARALMNTPEVLFLDEPTTGLDPKTRKQVWESIDKLREEENMTVFLTTHYMEEATRAQYICIIDSGKLVAEGTPSKLKKEYASDLLKVYSKNLDHIKLIAQSNSLQHEIMSNYISFPLENTKEAIAILEMLQEKYEAFEVLQGDMDDVFINITGKKLEEK